MDSQTFRFFAFLILTNLCISVTPQITKCSEYGSYMRSTTYHINLNNLLPSLPLSIGDNGFHNVSQGQSPDRVYAMALCRGDIQLDACRSCVQNATQDIVRLCPYRKQAVLWHILCMLRYSDEAFFGVRTDPPTDMVKNMNANVPSPDQFNEDLGTLLEDLRSRAASGGSLMKVAAWERTTTPNSTTIFALLQCSPDLSGKDCEGCLMTLTKRIPGCCNNSEGVRLLAPSCTLNYEIFPFYNIARIQEVEDMLSGPGFAPPVPATPSMPPALPVPSPRDLAGNDKNSIARTIIIIVIPIISCLILLACCIWLLKRTKKRLEQKRTSDTEISTAESLQYEFTKIREATNDFSDAKKLGEGGFGAVYKGKLQNGQEIAAKRLFMGLRHGDMEFKNEITLLAKLQHRNLVRLFGFARERIEKVFVYEFLDNGSLDHFLFDDQPTTHYLDWNTRFKIIGGVGKGLLYLPEGSQLRVIHRDLKASNILLDATMNPKIADFGIARLCDESEANTRRIVGTYGYMPPEYVHQGRLSIKTDVYSF